MEVDFEVFWIICIGEKLFCFCEIIGMFRQVFVVVEEGGWYQLVGWMAEIFKYDVYECFVVDGEIYGFMNFGIVQRVGVDFFVVDFDFFWQGFFYVWCEVQKVD